MNKKRKNGFTLIELIIALIILSLMMGAVIPGFVKIINKNKINASSNEILTFMNYARLKSMHYQNNVIVCPSVNNSSCSGSDWHSIIMFNDKNNDNAISSGENILKINHISQDIQTKNLLNTSNPKIIFMPNGTSKFISGFSSNTSVVLLCSSHLSNYSNILKVGISMGTTEIIKVKNGCN